MHIRLLSKNYFYRKTIITLYKSTLKLFMTYKKRHFKNKIEFSFKKHFYYSLKLLCTVKLFLYALLCTGAKHSIRFGKQCGNNIIQSIRAYFFAFKKKCAIVLFCQLVTIYNIYKSVNTKYVCHLPRNFIYLNNLICKF